MIEWLQPEVFVSDLILLRRPADRSDPATAQRRRALDLVLAADDRLLAVMVAALEALNDAAAQVDAGRCPAGPSS